jgi:hypothetical protein
MSNLNEFRVLLEEESGNEGHKNEEIMKECRAKVAIIFYGHILPNLGLISAIKFGQFCNLLFH